MKNRFRTLPQLFVHGPLVISFIALVSSPAHAENDAYFDPSIQGATAAAPRAGSTTTQPSQPAAPVTSRQMIAPIQIPLDACTTNMPNQVAAVLNCAKATLLSAAAYRAIAQNVLPTANISDALQAKANTDANAMGTALVYQTLATEYGGVDVGSKATAASTGPATDLATQAPGTVDLPDMQNIDKVDYTGLASPQTLGAPGATAGDPVTGPQGPAQSSSSGPASSSGGHGAVGEHATTPGQQGYDGKPGIPGTVNAVDPVATTGAPPAPAQMPSSLDLLPDSISVSPPSGDTEPPGPSAPDQNPSDTVDC